MTEDRFDRRLLLGLCSSRITGEALHAHRRRLYRDPLGYFIAIKDTWESPFVADGFPRGTLLVEYVSFDETDAAKSMDEWFEQHRIEIGESSQNYELIQVPSAVHRCRLYDLGSHPLTGSRDFAELWDTLEKPYESPEHLPPGNPIALEQDFSRKAVRIRMYTHWKNHGVISAGSWRGDAGI